MIVFTVHWQWSFIAGLRFSLSQHVVCVCSRCLEDERNCLGFCFWPKRKNFLAIVEVLMVVDFNNIVKVNLWKHVFFWQFFFVTSTMKKLTKLHFPLYFYPKNIVLVKLRTSLHFGLYRKRITLGRRKISMLWINHGLTNLVSYPLKRIQWKSLHPLKWINLPPDEKRFLRWQFHTYNSDNFITRGLWWYALTMPFFSNNSKISYWTKGRLNPA